MKLFRDEAIDHQRSKLMGDVVFDNPIKLSVIIFSLVFLLGIVIVFFFTQEYRQKASVSGYLVPQKGLTTIMVEQPAVIQKFYIQAGDKIKKNDNLVLMGTGKALSSGRVVSREIIDSLDRELEQIDSRIINENNMEDLRNKLLDVTTKKLQKDINFFAEEREILLRAKNIKDNQLAILDDMTKKGYGTKRDSNEEELKLLDYRQRLNKAEVNFVSKKQELIDTKNRSAVDSLNTKTTLSDLQQRKEQIFQQKINLLSQESYNIRSPVDGVVTSIFETLGSNLLTGSPILTIQPNDSVLIAKLAVPSRSIGLISDNQEVSLYYEAFPYQRFGVFKGIISNISLNVISPRQFNGPIEMSESFYFVDVTLSKNTVRAYGKDIPLLAGMKLKAEVILEKNTLVEWLISPIRAVSRKY